MTKDHWATVQHLYDAASEHPPEARRRFLREACGGDDALYAEVASLLSVETHHLLEGRALDAIDLPDILSAEGERIGPYRIEREIGRGGMGAVYLAARADGQFEQTVALKLIKRGMDSDAVLRRFYAERQILARLQHPGIARLLDGGLTDDGRPYLAMEFVNGEPITTHCDRLGLNVDARLDLFRQVCEAVGYAHQNLVVHRDLKPSNVLITETGTVQLLDFGIAKVLAGDDTPAPLTVLTAPDQRVLTPEYAAPEQVTGGPISTTTDVYALGVLLYELLTGQRPYTFEARTPSAIEHVVGTVQPSRPSTVVGEAPTMHGTPTERLRRRLAGDLDTICLTALRKEPERRYRSVEALAEDLRRHQQSLPVMARPDTLRYRARTFMHRHRVGLAALGASLLVLALVAATAFARVTAERDRAQTEADKAAEVSAFLASMLEGADPLDTPGQTLSAMELLERGAARIEDDLPEQPAVRAAMQHLMGEVYRNLGRYAEAESLLRSALDTRRRLHGDAHVEVAETARALGIVLRRVNRPDAAAPLLREALATQQALLGPEHPEAAYTMRQLASLLRDRGAFEQAETLYRNALAIARATLGNDHADVADIRNSLAVLLETVGRFDEAIVLMQEVIEADRRRGSETNPQLVGSLTTLSVLLRERGDLTGAEEVIREALRINLTVYGESHLETATSLRTLASILRDREQYGEAALLYERALAIRRDALGPDHPRIANLLNSYGTLRMDEGDFNAAQVLFGEALRIYRVQPQPDPAHVSPALHNLAGVYEAMDRPAEAEALYHESLALLRRTMPPGSADLAFPLVSLGSLLNGRGAYAEAAPLLEEAVTIRRAALPPEHTYTAQAERRLSDALAGLGRVGEARTVLRVSIGRLTETRGATDALTRQAQARLDALSRS
ncbi:MAG: serine/threonine protein kinase [Rhodothermaceae bacterium]|nr:serine/threonine protein kinase [Rhodothermaceae bacterium]